MTDFAAPTQRQQGRKAWMVAGVALLGIAIALVLATRHHSNDKSAAMEDAIKTTGQEQLQVNVTSLAPGATVDVNDVGCVKTSGTQEYHCLVHVTVADPSSGERQRYLLNASGTCASDGRCQWHTEGAGQPVGG